MEWNEIPGFEGLYAINKNAEVISLRTGKILAVTYNNKGYPYVTLHVNGKNIKITLHRLMAITFLPNPNNFPVVMHKDNDKNNYSLDNLKWGTYSENNAQAIADGLNKIPRPDNRKLFEVYKDSLPYRFICYGWREIAEMNGYGNDHIIHNAIHRQNPLTQGKFEGYKIKRYKPYKIDR